MGKKIINVVVIASFVVVIFFLATAVLSGKHSLGYLSYGGKFLPMGSEAMSDITRPEGYDGKYEYDIYAICDLSVVYFEEKGNITLENEKKEYKDSKEITINNHKWYIANLKKDEYNQEHSYLFTNYKNELYTVYLQTNEDCSEFSKQLINSLKF